MVFFPKNSIDTKLFIQEFPKESVESGGLSEANPPLNPLLGGDSGVGIVEGGFSAKNSALIHPTQTNYTRRKTKQRKIQEFYFAFKNSSTVSPLFLIRLLNKPGASSLWLGIDSVGLDS
jgi:hypothetical protein